MSDLKRIGNRSLMSRLADLLGIEGVTQRAPISLDTSRLVPVVVVGSQGSFPEYHAFMDLASHEMFGRSSYAYGLYGNVGSAAQDTATPVKLPSWQGKEHWVRAIRLALTYDAAGATADNEDWMKVSVEVRTTGGTPDDIAYVIEERFMVMDGIVFYPWVYPQSEFQNQILYGAKMTSKRSSSWNGYVPPGYQVVVRIERESGGTWPANTTLHGSVWVSEAPLGVITNGH